MPRRLVAGLLLLASCPLAMLAFSHWGRHLFPAYRTFSKALMGGLAWLAAWVPWAVWDWLLLALGVLAAVTLVRRVRGHRPVLPWVSTVVLVAGLGTAAAVDGWALNHYAPPLASELGLEVRQYSVDELAEATTYYLGQAADLAPQVPRGEDGALVRQDFAELAHIAGASYEDLSGSCPVFAGSTEPVKPLVLWGPELLYSGHTGIFWAATGESCVPVDVAVAEEPFTMCHEAAHRLGIASEQEANFAAFLACDASYDVRLRYAGYYDAFCYCYNALASADADRARELAYDALSDDATGGVRLVLGDRAATSEHYAAYEGPFEDVGRTVNDTYLHSFGEEAGVRSYGLVVDYLLAWYLR